MRVRSAYLWFKIENIAGFCERGNEHADYVEYYC
jgi:hypothetical protein